MILAPDRHFKMDKGTKIALALVKFKNTEARSEYRKSMIQGQLHEEAARKAALKSKDRSKDKESE